MLLVLVVLLSGSAGGVDGGSSSVWGLRHVFRGDCAAISLPSERGETLSATELAAWAECFRDPGSDPGRSAGRQ